MPRWATIHLTDSPGGRRHSWHDKSYNCDVLGSQLPVMNFKSKEQLESATYVAPGRTLTAALRTRTP